MRSCAPARLSQAGVVSPFGVILLTLGLIVMVALIGFIGRSVSNAHVAVAQRTALVVANRAAVVGLDHLINGTLPGTTIPIIALPEPLRTQAVQDQIESVALPGPAARRYLAPFGAGDVQLQLSMLSAQVTVTARAGRQGQFVSTATRIAAARAANAIGAGQLLEAPGVAPIASGVLPLAVDVSAFGTDLGAASAAGPLPLQIGTSAFAASPLVTAGGLDGSAGANALLRDAAAFLAFSGEGKPSGLAPPAFAVGQKLVLAVIDPAVSRASEAAPEAGVRPSIVEIRQAAAVSGSEPYRAARAVETVQAEQAGWDHLASLEALAGRPVIVPVVDRAVVQAFAVGRLERSEQGLSLSLMTPALSPLARLDPAAPRVNPRLAQKFGLAMGLEAIDPEQEELDAQRASDVALTSAVGLVLR